MSQNHKPIRDLAGVLNRKFGSRPAGGYVVMGTGRIPISDCKFHEVPTLREPRTMACVDGGSSTLLDTPAFSVVFNRLFCSVFHGQARLQSPAVPAIQFYSLLLRARDGFSFELFPYGDHPEVLPDAGVLNGAAAGVSLEGGEEGRHRLLSLPRVLGEWKTAAAATRRLSKGDCLVMDGSLSMWGRTHREPARTVMAEARAGGVVFCGLSKTTSLCMDNGWPLLDYLRDRYSDRKRTPWYVDIGRPPENPKAGDVHTMVAMLHGATRWLYRLDMDAVTRRDLGDEGTGEVLASLAANSSDAMLPGYPYGLSHADRHAQVRHDEGRVLASHLAALLDGAPRRFVVLNTQHDYLNEVTG